MDVERARWAMKKIARRQGLTEKQVVADIEFAIDEALETAHRESDLEVLAKWEAIPCKGSRPTAYEL